MTTLLTQNSTFGGVRIAATPQIYVFNDTDTPVVDPDPVDPEKA